MLLLIVLVALLLIALFTRSPCQNFYKSIVIPRHNLWIFSLFLFFLPLRIIMTRIITWLRWRYLFWGLLRRRYFVRILLCMLLAASTFLSLLTFPFARSPWRNLFKSIIIHILPLLSLLLFSFSLRIITTRINRLLRRRWSDVIKVKITWTLVYIAPKESERKM